MKTELNLETKEVDNRKYAQLTDIFMELWGALNGEDKKDIVRQFLQWTEMPNMLAELLKGELYDENKHTGSRWSPEDYMNGDRLRQALSDSISPAHKILTENLMSVIKKQYAQLNSMEDHVKNIEAQWPEAYAKYKPKMDYIYPKYATEEEVLRLLEVHIPKEIA